MFILHPPVGAIRICCLLSLNFLQVRERARTHGAAEDGRRGAGESPSSLSSEHFPWTELNRSRFFAGASETERKVS